MIGFAIGSIGTGHRAHAGRGALEGAREHARLDDLPAGVRADRGRGLAAARRRRGDRHRRGRDAVVRAAQLGRAGGGARQRARPRARRDLVRPPRRARDRAAARRAALRGRARRSRCSASPRSRRCWSASRAALLATRHRASLRPSPRRLEPSSATGTLGGHPALRRHRGAHCRQTATAVPALSLEQRSSSSATRRSRRSAASPAAAAAAPAGIRPTSSEPVTSAPRRSASSAIRADDLVQRGRLPVLDVHRDLHVPRARQRRARARARPGSRRSARAPRRRSRAPPRASRAG